VGAGDIEGAIEGTSINRIGSLSVEMVEVNSITLPSALDGPGDVCNVGLFVGGNEGGVVGRLVGSCVSIFVGSADGRAVGG
jgi:hypothetical protein